MQKYYHPIEPLLQKYIIPSHHKVHDYGVGGLRVNGFMYTVNLYAVATEAH